MNRTVLILGANGRFGSAAAAAFADAGWNVIAQVRRLARSGGAAPHRLIRSIAVPLERTDELVAAAAGANTVVHAINPLYTQWASEVLPLGRLGMDAALRLGATFMLPGNVYNFGAGMPGLLGAATPQRPNTRKGRIRADLEGELRARTAQGLRSIVIRAGDFYGCSSGSWFDQAIVKSLARGKLVYPGPLDVPHAWAYVPDLARAFVAVAERSGGASGFADLPFAGHTLTGAELLTRIEAAAGRALKRGSLPWPLIRAGGLVIPMWRELAEMAYLWRVPHALDGRALAAVTGPLPATPIDVAITSTLAAMGLAGAPNLSSNRARQPGSTPTTA